MALPVPVIATTTLATGNINSIQRPIVLTEHIENLSVSDIPLVMFSKEARRKSIEDYNTNWLETQYFPRINAINLVAGYLAGDTVLVVDNAAYFKAGDIVTVTRTLETMSVTSIDTVTNEITVERSWGTTAAAALLDDDELLIIGYASTEGGSAPEMRATIPGTKTNYVQTFRTSFRLTKGLGNNVKLLTGSELASRRTEKLDEHLIDIERSALFGESRQDLTNTDDPRRTMGGLREFITSNVNDFGGVMAKADFDSFLRDVMQKGSKNKLVLSAPIVNGAISGFAGNSIRTVPQDETFGIHIKEYISPHGRVHISEHRLLGESTEFAGWFFVLDMSKIWMPVLMDTIHRMNIQANDELKAREEYVTELTMEVMNDLSHGIGQGVTG